MDRVRIILHGGEPLMLKKADMALLLQSLVDACQGTVLELSIQTNAMLIDDAWIDLFAKYQVYVGISLDGPQPMNDENRIDKRGRGTYERTIIGVRKLFSAYEAGRILRPGVLCVVNPDFPAEEVYQHFVRELGFLNIDFLLPDNNHDTMSAAQREKFDDYMLTLLRLYRAESKSGLQFRFFDKFVKEMTMLPFFRTVLHRFFTQKGVVFTVSSKGDIAPDDILRTTDPRMMQLGLNVATHSLQDVLLDPVLNQLNDYLFTLPKGCQGCDFETVCHGGDLYHRYRSANGFDNPSIYCGTLKKVLAEIAETLVVGGVSIEQLEANLQAQPYRRV